MQVIINIEKKHLVFLVLFVAIIGITGYSIAFQADGDSDNDPNLMGHSFNEMGWGTLDLGNAGKGVKFVGDTNGQPLVAVYDDGPTISGSSALDVKGHFSVTRADTCTPTGEPSDNCGDVYLKTTVRSVAPSGSPLPLCIEHNPGDANNDGRVVVCP